MLADGAIVECSRDKECRTVRSGDGRLRPVRHHPRPRRRDDAERLLQRRRVALMPADAVRRAVHRRRREAIRRSLMAYGRLSVARASFFHEALMTTYRAAAPQPSPLPAAATRRRRHDWRSRATSTASRSAASAAKRVALVRRNPAQSQPRLAASRRATALMNEPVANLANPYPTRTDILHEYFVPPRAVRRVSRGVPGSHSAGEGRVPQRHAALRRRRSDGGAWRMRRSRASPR